jgi:pyruvate dehydrogenase E1 component alpha subunit
MGKTKTANTKTNGQTEVKTYSKEQVERWYYQMLLMRRFEERSAILYSQQKIRGFCHLYIGQEAVGAGVESAIRPDDYVITAYRDHGNALARGVSARACMAELYGKVTGCTKGKGGSMHMFSKEKNFVGGHGIVGAQIPLGAGLAFASKYLKQDRVTVCLFGDGAARQGSLHETFNLAMLWQLPVIFICENNNYAMGTSVERSSNVTDIYTLGEAYDMPSKPVNGMSVIDVHEAMVDAAEHCRSGKGPIFLEMKTYRYKGHSMSDPQKYRTREELAQYQEQDPIANLGYYAMERNLLTQAEIDAYEEKVKAEVEDSVKFAEESPFPDPSELYTDVYVTDYPFVMD